MNKDLKNIGLIAMAAGILYYPALKMYRLAQKKKGERDDYDADMLKLRKNNKNEPGSNSNNNMGVA